MNQKYYFGSTNWSIYIRVKLIYYPDSIKLFTVFLTRYE